MPRSPPPPRQPATFYVSPVKVFHEEGGPPWFEATLLEGFTTQFSAYVLDSKGQSRNITSDVIWEAELTAGSGGLFTIDRKARKGAQEVAAVALGTGRAVLKATYRGQQLLIGINILESDMLVYAPDGLVYRIPTEIWTHAKEADPNDPHPIEVVWYKPEDIPRVKGLLDEEVALANVPNRSTGPYPGPSAAPSDNITCFILNLNSIVMSYSPSPARQPRSITTPMVPLSGPSKSGPTKSGTRTARAKTPSSRRKR